MSFTRIRHNHEDFNRFFLIIADISALY